MGLMAQGRTAATVTEKHDYHCFALDDWGTRYFILHSAVSKLRGLSFYDICVGTRVKLTPIDHPKGPRGIEVEILSL